MKIDITRDNYNNNANAYNTWINNNRIFEQDKYSNLLLQNLKQNSKLLELGCGSAPKNSTKKFINCCNYLGVDFSEKQIEIAKQNYPKAKFECQNISNLKFPHNSFDAVASFYVLFLLEFEEQKKVFKNIFNWLKPEGYFCSSYMAENKQSSRVVKFFDGDQIYLFSIGQYKSILKEVGFKILNLEIITEDEFGEPEPILWILAQKPTK